MEMRKKKINFFVFCGKITFFCYTHILMSRKYERHWGWFIVLYDDDHCNHKIKKIYLYPGKRLSLQSHNERSEHWVIVNGLAKVQVNDSFYTLSENEHVYIPKQSLHRIENIGYELLEFTETQIGDYLGEDDIIRYEDDFGRC